MNETKGLLVVPKRGKSHPFQHLVVAEKYAQTLVEQGRGPVEIVSRFTGDTLAMYGAPSAGDEATEAAQ